MAQRSSKYATELLQLTAFASIATRSANSLTASNTYFGYYFCHTCRSSTIKMFEKDEIELLSALTAKIDPGPQLALRNPAVKYNYSSFDGLELN